MRGSLTPRHKPLSFGLVIWYMECCHTGWKTPTYAVGGGVLRARWDYSLRKRSSLYLPPRAAFGALFRYYVFFCHYANTTLNSRYVGLGFPPGLLPNYAVFDPLPLCLVPVIA